MALDIYLNENGEPDYRKSVREGAVSMGVDPSLAESMMLTESGGNPSAQSPKGAVGLMQLMGPTAKQYGVDPSDPQQNIEGGLKHLKYLLGKYNGSVPHAVAAYNAGEGTLDRVLAGKAHLPTETLNYVQRVTGQPFNGQQPPPQPQSSNPRTGTWTDYIPNIKPSDYPTIGGIAGGLLGTLTTGGIAAPALAAMIGGMAGSATQQQMENKTGLGTGKAPQIDPIQTTVEGAKQGAWEAGGQLLGAGLRRGGASLYANGAGLSRPQLSQNFPTAIQEGLQGGRGTMPVFTAAGARRIYNRTAPLKGEMIAAADAAGTTATPIDVVKNGLLDTAKNIRANASLPETEGTQAGNYIKKFIEENSTVRPAQPTMVPAFPPSQVGGQQILQPGMTRPSVVPKNWTMGQLEGKKEFWQGRAQNAFKATNADRALQLQADMDVGSAQGAKNTLEQKIPGLEQLNRRLQGQIGLNQSLNPSFRTPEELRAMGVNPDVANVMTQARSPYSIQRGLVDAAGALGLGAGTVGGHPGLAALIWGGAHATASPLGQRLIGGTAYTAGRMTPMVGRGIHVAANSAMQPTPDNDPQLEALRQAILNGQIK